MKLGRCFNKGFGEMLVWKYIQGPATISMESWAISWNCCWTVYRCTGCRLNFSKSLPTPASLPEICTFGLDNPSRAGSGVLEFSIIQLIEPLIKDCYRIPFLRLPIQSYIHSRNRPTPPAAGEPRWELGPFLTDNRGGVICQNQQKGSPYNFPTCHIPLLIRRR